MKCIRPTKFPNSQGFFASCGQCMPCRITRRVEWHTKLMLEWKTFNTGVFVTLTYAPEHLPESQHFSGGSLEKTDLQKFLKRLRFNYQKKYGETKIRHFAVGEYGDKSQRAHYHLLLFNIDPQRAELMINKSWTLGLSQTDELNENRIKYTVGYTIKKMTALENFPDGRVPEFSIQSKNPSLGSYQIPTLGKMMIKHGLFPSRSMTNESTWILEQDGFQPKLWSGVFFRDKSGNLEFPLTDEYKPSKGAQYCRLDTHMMKTLAKHLKPYLNDYLEARTALLTPKGYRVRRDRLTNHSYLDKILYEGSEEYAENIKKSDKINRQHGKTRTI